VFNEENSGIIHNKQCHFFSEYGVKVSRDWGMGIATLTSSYKLGLWVSVLMNGDNSNALGMETPSLYGCRKFVPEPRIR
jgi:D-serine dehydratase